MQLPNSYSAVECQYRRTAATKLHMLRTGLMLQSVQVLRPKRGRYRCLQGHI